jgi:hypothetical protein
MEDEDFDEFDEEETGGMCSMGVAGADFDDEYDDNDGGGGARGGGYPNMQPYARPAVGGGRAGPTAAAGGAAAASPWRGGGGNNMGRPMTAAPEPSVGAAPRVHTLSGAARAGMENPVGSVTSSGRRQVVVTYQVMASLDDFAHGRVAPRLGLKAGSKGFFESASAVASGSAPSKHHVLYNAKIVKVHNGFPVAFHIRADAVKGVEVACKSAVDCGDGQCVMGDHLIHGDESSTYGDNGVILLRGNGAAVDETRFAKEYPMYNESNLENGIKPIEMPNGDKAVTALVAYGHPVTSYFDTIRQNSGWDRLGPRDIIEGTGHFIANYEDVQTCIANIRSRMSGTSTNLYDFGFSIKRVFGDIPEGEDAPSFADGKELAAKYASPATADAVKAQAKMLTISVQYDFRPS